MKHKVKFIVSINACSFFQEADVINIVLNDDDPEGAVVRRVLAYEVQYDCQIQGKVTKKIKPEDISEIWNEHTGWISI